jgi:hypothetical protein
MARRQEGMAGPKSRADRLAEELRANLARRKAQARGRKDPIAPDANRTGDGTAEETDIAKGRGDRSEP